MENACHTNINQKVGCIAILFSGKYFKGKIISRESKGYFTISKRFNLLESNNPKFLYLPKTSSQIYKTKITDYY